MKNKSDLIRKCILIAILSFMYFVLPKVTTNWIFIPTIVLCFEGLMMLQRSKTFNGIWISDECEEKFNISLWGNIKSFNIFNFKNKLYYRQFYCTKCNKKVWCRCTFEN